MKTALSIWLSTSRTLLRQRLGRLSPAGLHRRSLRDSIYAVTAIGLVLTPLLAGHPSAAGAGTEGFRVYLPILQKRYVQSGSATPAPGSPTATATPAAGPTATVTPASGAPTATATPMPSTPVPASTPVPTPTTTPTSGERPSLQNTLRPSLSPYGVNDWNWYNEAGAAAGDAGMSWARLQGVIWRNIEPVQGSFNWNVGATSRVDDYVARATAAGMKITAPIWLAPEWAWQPGLTLPRPEPAADFVTAFLNRYPGKIAAVEILAEENTGNWPQTKNRDAVFYVPILKAAYEAVKRVSPNTLVVTSSLWGSPEGYLEDLYALGAGGYFDVVNFHYYPGNKPAAVNYTWWISHLRKVMEKYGDGGKPLWLTEFAWTTTDEHRLGGAADIVSPQEQLDNLNYVLDASMRSGFIEKVFWYVMHDDDGMALMHVTDKYDWRTPQPGLVAATLRGANSITVAGDWTKRWPQYGTLIADGEQMEYSSLALMGADTVAQGLVRGAYGTTAANHAAGTTVYNREQTRNAKRPAYYAYADFIRARPTWTQEQVAPLPGVPLPASRLVPVANPGFEDGSTGWWGSLTIDKAQYHSGTASAKLTNTTGNLQTVGQRLVVEPEKSYFLKAWVKIDQGGSGNMTAMVAANLNDSSGKFVDMVPGNYFIYETNGSWREIHFPFKTPANVTQITLFLATEAGTGAAWFDDLSVEPYTLQ